MDWMHRLKGRNCVLLCSLQRPGVHNFSFQFSSLMSRLCFPLFSSISHILSVSETFEDWLWYYQLALETSHQHARSLTFSIPRARQNRLDLHQKTWEHWGGGYLVSGVKPVNSNQPPNPLPILINGDNLCFEYPNQWSMARSTCRALLPVTNWRKWFMSNSVSGAGGGGAESPTSHVTTLMYSVWNGLATRPGSILCLRYEHWW